MQLSIAATAWSEATLRGDMNCDYQIDLSDALKLLKATTSIEIGNSWCSADVNSDRKSDLTEILFVLQSVSGLHHPLDRAYLPLSPGDTWQYKVTDANTGLPAAPYTKTYYCSGETLIGGKSVLVLNMTEDQGPNVSYEEYYQISPSEVTYWGNTSTEDFISQQTSPIIEIPFFINPGDSWSILDNENILWEDLDADLQGEATLISRQGTFIDFTNVSTASGNFSNCAHLQYQTSYEITLSGSGGKVNVSQTRDTYLYPMVGPVKILTTTVATGPGGTSQKSFEENLVSFRVSGLGRNYTSPKIIAEHLAQANSDTQTPGRPGIGTNGKDHLIVTYRKFGSPNGLVGILMVPDISLYKEFIIDSYTGNFPNPAVGFDGKNYLVVYQKNGVIRGVRVTPTGQVIDKNGGFTVSTGSSNWTPAIAFDGSQYLVAWNKYNDQTGHDIYGAVISPEGQTQTEFPISTQTRNQTQSTLAFDGVNFLAAWVDERNAVSPDYYSNVYGARISKNTVVLDLEGLPVATANTYKSRPLLDFDGNNYFITWQDIPETGISPPISSIFARRITPDGALLDGSAETNGIAVNTTAVGKSFLTLAFDGQYHRIAWCVGAYNNSPPVGIYSAMVSKDGTLIDGPADSLGQLVLGPPPSFTKYAHPILSVNGNSKIMTWVNNIELSGTVKNLMSITLPP